MHIYPGAEHAFNGPWAWTYSAPAAEDAWRRSVAFLKQHLGT